MSPTTKSRRHIGTREVADKLRCHVMSVPRLVREGRLPKPHKILNRNVWVEDEIDKLVKSGLPRRRAEAVA